MPAVFFLFVFFLYFSFLSEPYFTDEQDVFFGAYNVIKGQDIYRAFLSQHMPFSYYMAAPIALLGARTVYQFRLGVYLLLSLVWEAAFLRHRKHIHPAALFAMPLLYLTALKTLYMGTTMISDHWQGLGLVLILLELVRYEKSREISLPCAGMICLGIVLSLGTSFASAYSLLCLFLAAAVLQIQAIVQDRRAGDPAGRLKEKRDLREDERLVLICLAPFGLLGGWYALSGNLANFWSGAYEIVTQVYSKYTGGMGSDPVGVVWDTVRRYGIYLGETVQRLPASLWPGLLYLLLAAGLPVFAFRMGRRSPAVGLLVLLAAVYGGLRSFDDFHAMAYYAQASAALALLLGETLQYAQKRPAPVRRAAWAAAAAAGAALTVHFVIWAGYNLLYPQILLDRTQRCEERILDLLTEPEEKVFVCNAPVNSLDVMDLELIPKEACGAISYPYFYEMWGDRQMASIRDLPHVVLYDGEEEIWGYVFREYAPDFDRYMEEHYTRLPQAETIWVSNEFLPEARRRLREQGYGDLVRTGVKTMTENVPVKVFPEEKVSTRFTAEEERLSAIRFCAACFNRRSDPTLLVQLRDAETGVIIAEREMSGEEIADNFFTRCPLPAELERGKEYAAEITVLSIGGKGDMEFYYTPEGSLAAAEEYDTEAAGKIGGDADGTGSEPGRNGQSRKGRNRG